MSQKQRVERILKKFDEMLSAKIDQKNSTNMNETQFINKQFKYFDVSNLGQVNFEQFQRAIEKIGVVMPQFDLEQVFKAYDVSGDGNLDFKEFSQMFTQKTGMINNENYPSNNDPYLEEKERQQQMQGNKFDSPSNLMKLFRDKLKHRGMRGMIGLQRVFDMMDDDQSGSLTSREFWKACKEFKLGISEENIPILFAAFDTNGDGTMSY